MARGALCERKRWTFYTKLNFFLHFFLASGDHVSLLWVIHFQKAVWQLAARLQLRGGMDDRELSSVQSFAQGLTDDDCACDPVLKYFKRLAGGSDLGREEQLYT